MGIGTTAPDTSVHILGGGASTMVMTVQSTVGSVCAGATAEFIQFLKEDDTVIGKIIQTPGNGSEVQHLTNSDYRLKEDVLDMRAKDAVDQIMRARPVTYTWKSGGAPGRGFIAHELAAAGFESAVSGEKDVVRSDGNIDAQGIDTSKMAGEVVRVIQYLVVELEAVKGELKAVNAELEVLRNQ